jgi:autotransporter translocation and assembly factor TamB
MKRAVLGLLVLILIVVVGLLWVRWPYVTSLLRQRLEYEISRAVHGQTRIGSMTFSMLPLGLRLDGVEVTQQSPIARIERIELRLFLLASLAEGRLVAAVEVHSPMFDLSHPRPSEAQTSGVTMGVGPNLLPLHLRRVEVTDAQVGFRLGQSPATLGVARMAGEVNVRPLRRATTVRVEASGIEVRRKSFRVQVSELRAEGGVDRGGVFVEAASVQGQGISASVNATATAHRHKISATFDPGLLGVLVDELSAIGGDAELQGTLQGDLANPVLDARLVIQRGAIAHHRLGDFDARVRRAGATLSFDDIHLAGAAGRVTGAVDLTIDKEVPIHGELRWLGVDLEAMLATIGASVPFSNQLEATTLVQGSLDPLDLGVTGHGVLRTPGANWGTDEAQWEIGGRVRAQKVETHLDVTQPERNRLAVRLQLAGPQLAGTMSLTAADLRALNMILPRPVRLLALTGHGEASATFGGTTEHPSIAGSVTLNDLTMRGARVPRLSGDFSIAAGQLTTRSTRIDTAAGNAELRGALALDSGAQNDWQLDLHELDTDVVVDLVRGLGGVQAPVSGGTLGGALHCRGEWRRAEAHADLTATGLHVGREPLDRIDLKVTTTLPRWALQLHAVHRGSETLAIDGAGEGMAQLDVHFETTPLDLGQLRRAAARHFAGRVSLRGRIVGEPLRLGGWVDLRGEGLGTEGRPLGDIAVRAQGQRGEWTLHGEAFDTSITMEATLHTTGPLPYTLVVTWRDADLSRLVPGDESLRVTSSGQATLGGTLRTITVPTGTLVVSQFDVRRDEYQVTASQPVHIDVDAGRFRIRSFILEGQGSRLTVAGEWTSTGQVGLDLEGNANLVLLELIGPPFQSSRGHITVTGHVQRTADAGWTLSGQATLRDATLDLGLPVTCADTDGDFTLAGSVIHVDRLKGKSGGGTFSLGGQVDLNRGPAVSWVVKDVSLNVPEWLEERVSGKGDVTGTWRVLTVRGGVEVLNALYDHRIELTDFLPWFKAQVAPAPRAGAAATEIRLDVHVHSSGGLYIDNNFAKAEMRADLRVTGNTDKPVLSGTVEVLSGEVTFRDRTFLITAGSVDFRDGFTINPLLNITAESRITTTDADYTVFVAVSGTADNPRVEFSADDPGLSQNDILSLVTTGKTAAQLQREGGGVSVTDVLALVPTAPVSQQFRTLLGVDRFEIEPVYSRDTGAFEPRVTIGKDITDRIRVLGSSGLGVQARRSMNIEYRYSRRISLLGGWEGQTTNQAGAFAGDIKFRYEFRTLPFSLLGRDP